MRLASSRAAAILQGCTLLGVGLGLPLGCGPSKEPAPARAAAPPAALPLAQQQGTPERVQRFREAPVFLDGQPVGALQYGEPPPRPAPMTGEAIRRLPDELLFSFSSGTRGKPRLHWISPSFRPADQIDLVTAVAIWKAAPPGPLALADEGQRGGRRPGVSLEGSQAATLVGDDGEVLERMGGEALVALASASFEAPADASGTLVVHRPGGAPAEVEAIVLERR